MRHLIHALAWHVLGPEEFRARLREELLGHGFRFAGFTFFRGQAL